jgi:hypothetical protein
VEQLHSFCFHLDVELGQARQVASRTVEAFNEAKLDWINTDGKDNWYCPGSFFGGQYRRSVDRRDHSNITSN